MTDDTYSIKEFIGHYMEDMKGQISEIHTDVKEIKLQTQKTNGRVTAIETAIQDYPEIKKKVGQLDNYKWWIIGIAAAISAIGLLALKQIVKQSVDTALSERVSTITEAP